MMGERTVAQEALFYSFNLERHVTADHLLRSIDRFVIYRAFASICGHTTARQVGPRSTLS